MHSSKHEFHYFQQQQMNIVVYIQSHQLDHKMNIRHKIAITNEFELWDHFPFSQKAKSNNYNSNLLLRTYRVQKYNWITTGFLTVSKQTHLYWSNILMPDEQHWAIDVQIWALIIIIVAWCNNIEPYNTWCTALSHIEPLITELTFGQDWP